jgi:hypothetical protein
LPLVVLRSEHVPSSAFRRFVEALQSLSRDDDRLTAETANAALKHWPDYASG